MVCCVSIMAQRMRAGRTPTSAVRDEASRAAGVVRMNFMRKELSLG
jgi:hypothetical protein